MSNKRILSIAGSDPSGGAGLQADIRTITSLGAYAMAVVTALTAQNSTAVFATCPVASDFVASQIDAVFAEFSVDAIKTGMLGDAALVEVVSERLAFYGIKRLVVDPVLVATSGAKLLADDGLQALRDKLLKIAFVTTPNIPEAEALTGIKISSLTEAKKALCCLHQLGAQNVVLTGGHWQGDSALDILYDGEMFVEFNAPRLNVKNTHGTGCVFASALACQLAFGVSIPKAIGKAKEFVRQLLINRNSLA